MWTLTSKQRSHSSWPMLTFTRRNRRNTTMIRWRSGPGWDGIQREKRAAAQVASVTDWMSPESDQPQWRFACRSSFVCRLSSDARGPNEARACAGSTQSSNICLSWGLIVYDFETMKKGILNVITENYSEWLSSKDWTGTHSDPWITMSEM